MVEQALRQRAYRLIVLLGMVSLLGDVTYEGVRGVTGPYLALLGASATAVGLVAGLGEFVGYALRTVAGYVADRLRSYWLLTFVGYAAIGALPLLALVHRWELAAFLIVLERLGKALRTPSRDAILSHAASQVGRGKGFGLHEALDQLGALIGPALFALALAWDGTTGYRVGFALLSLPTLATVLVLLVAWRGEPEPETLETHHPVPVPVGGSSRLSAAFWRYAAFTAVTTLGFAPFALLSYHFETQHLVPAATIPLLYALAMGIDGVVALFAGWGYDRFGLVTLAAVPVFTALAGVAALQTHVSLVVLGLIAWGIAMGLIETTMRAAVGDLSPRDVRGFAYGIFNTIFGAAWLAGGVLLGILYERVGPSETALAIVAIQAASLLFFFGLGVVRAHRTYRSWTTV
ncbi:MFS transporter [Thermomicrobium sp. 4228-Ro]|uniref:MFS transporter n=1 Tax=Thermomicrobium sp. 4228-Ro TaxID=2993937 RepID=UPI002248B890|nr:MFS transporter [Thermomicrobium sp. 4228-Ro]MCX2726299.1 MFS transporter [Thermomicrobium sp. 4228-Ro]